MGKRIVFLLLMVGVGFQPVQAQTKPLKRAASTERESVIAPTPEMIEAEYLRVAKKCEFTIGTRVTTPTVTGELLAPEEAKIWLPHFFAAIDIFPVRFLRETKLHTVVLCHDLMLRGQRAGGVATSEGVIYLNVPFQSHVIYHEMFHIADTTRQNPQWVKLNPKGFTYQGNIYDQDDAPTHSRNKTKTAVLDVDSFRKDFVSDYAMTAEVEDRAETFAWMVAQPRAFMELMKTRSVLAKKADVVKSIVRTFSPAMNRDFWVFIANSDDATRMADLHKRAVVNDRLKKEKKAILNSGYVQ